jgi:hypothetical protein
MIRTDLATVLGVVMLAISTMPVSATVSDSKTEHMAPTEINLTSAREQIRPDTIQIAVAAVGKDIT